METIKPYAIWTKEEKAIHWRLQKEITLNGMIRDVINNWGIETKKKLLAALQENLFPNPDIIEYDGFCLNRLRYEIKYDNKIIPLVGYEYTIFCILFSNPMRVYGRAELLRLICNPRCFESLTTQRSIDVRVSIINKKFGKKVIHSIKNIGYRFAKKDNI